MEEVFWFNNLSILYTECYVFLPSTNYSLIQNLNAIVRFFILYSLLSFMIYQKLDVFIPLLLVMIISIILYCIKDYIKENYTNLQNINPQKIEKKFVTSTKKNPVMNVNITDYNNNKELIIDKNVSNETINNNLTNNLYDDMGDISNKNMFERQFYTTPNNKIPNDQTEFAKWLYDNGPTCKEKTVECINTIADRVSIAR
tara:strand:+ start:210 stop:809 length:600 start_codon:yes stop_codon:yes gene_type:complete